MPWHRSQHPPPRATSQPRDVGLQDISTLHVDELPEGEGEKLPAMSWTRVWFGREADKGGCTCYQILGPGGISRCKHMHGAL